MGKVAIITGGVRGIGYGIVKRFAEDGYSVAVMDINVGEEYRENIDYIKSIDEKNIFFKGSITSAEDRKAFLDMVINTFGHVDVLVNDAGVAPKVRKDILEMTEESFDYVVGTNLKGTMFMTQLVANQMIKQPMVGKKKGTIINIGSASCTVSSPNRAEYCMSKAGIGMLTVVYADRLAEEGIMVHEVRPGVIDTDMNACYSDETIQALVEKTPLARLGKPEDIAKSVFFLADDASSFITGQILTADGGFTL